MSLGGSLSGISFAGIGTGIDTASIVQQLMQIESIPVTRMKANQAKIEARLSLYDQLSSKITALRTAASGLNSDSSFNPVTSSVADASVASLSVGNSANVGTYTLNVTTLARNHKVMSSPQSDATSALNLTGDLVVNGKLVKVSASDTLTSIASKINSSGGGVTASILGGSGGAYLTLTANESGASNRLQLSDSTGSVLASLGVVSGAAALREPVTDGFRSFGFSSQTAVLGTLTGSSKSGSFQIGTETINFDFATDSLDSLASRINAAFSGQGLTATVVDAKVGSKTVKKLEVTGLAGRTMTDTDGILSDLGVLERGFGNQVTEAKDAAFSIDGIAKTSYSNAVTDVIPGATITLLKESSTTTLDIKRDNSKVKDSFKSYMEAFNGLMDYVKTNSTFDTKTFVSGPLFGDSAAAQVVASVQSAVFQQVRSGNVRSLADIGFGLDSDGKLTLDEAALDKALSNGIQDVRAALVSAGAGSIDDIAFLAGTSKTQDSGAAGYSVEIAQAATIASTVGNIAQTQGNRGGETLTFSGKAFSTSVQLAINAGTSAADLAAQINSHASLKDKVTASVDGNGKLKIEAKRYGSALDFSVVSNLDADVDTSGIGQSGGVRVTGVDVAGKINNEDAVGNGQFLTGKDSNTQTAGLQIQYKGTATGIVGTVTYSRGLSNRMMGALDGMSDPLNGLLTETKKQLQEQVNDISKSITNLQETLAIREVTLKNKFMAMERAVAQLQSQQAQLSKFSG